MIKLPTETGNGSGAKKVRGGLILPMYACCVCGSEVKKPRYAVRLIDGEWVATPEEAEATHVVRPNGTIDDNRDSGWLPVGANCLRKHPELKPYTIPWDKAID